MKRYRVTMEFYVYAESDEQGQKKAFHAARRIERSYDNGAQVLSIETAPVGEIGNNKQIWP
jgi:hypothetical protein